MQLSSSAKNVLIQLEMTLIGWPKNKYREKLPVLSDSSIGMHVRHILEFYLCLLNGLETGLVDYDKRERDISIEEDPMVAIHVIGKITKCLEKAKDKKLILQVNYEENKQENTDKHVLSTSYERELAYNIEHTIHHMAIIKIGLKNIDPEIALPGDFGVAASTIRYRKTEQKIRSN